MSKVKLFDIPFDNFNFDDLLDFFEHSIQERRSSYILTCNVDHLIKLQKDERFRRIYREADAVIADGMPIVWASKLLRRPLKQRVSGSDILLNLGDELAARGYRLFFLGSAEGVAEAARRELLARFPGLCIVGCYSPSFGFESNEQENEQIIRMLQEARPDIVLVGVGAPKQEKWIHEYYQVYQAPISIGVGATFDFISGSISRAPVLFQKTGFEWLWRLCQEPRRLWRRYLVDDVFFIRLLLGEIRKSRGRDRHESY